MNSPVTTSSLKSTRPVAPSKPSVPLPPAIGCWQRPRTSKPVETSGSHFDVNLYVVGKRPHGAAIQSSNEDLFTALLVHAARRPVVRRADYLRVPATFQASRHNQGVAREVL